MSHMNTTLAIQLAQSLSLIACILFAVWYVVPWLESRSRTEALVPLVWVRVMRNFALQLYSAQQAGFAVSEAAPLRLMLLRAGRFDMPPPLLP